MFTRVVVLADDLAPDGGGFAGALDWARRLRSPLQIFCPREGMGPAGGNGTAAGDGKGPAEVCWDTATRQGVSCVTKPWPDAGGLRQHLRPGDLFVFGHSLPGPTKRDLVRQAFRCAGAGVFACPERWAGVSRALVLDQGGPAGPGFLAAAARLARSLPATAAVLTVARSERSARRRQQLARDVLSGLVSEGDFERAVGSADREAVVAAARRAGCQLVILERSCARSWWGWSRRRTAMRLMGTPEALGFLALSEVAVPAVSSAAAPAPGRLFPLPALH